MKALEESLFRISSALFIVGLMLGVFGLISGSPIALFLSVVIGVAGWVALTISISIMLLKEGK